jgi:hypothetical protein
MATKGKECALAEDRNPSSGETSAQTLENREFHAVFGS